MYYVYIMTNKTKSVLYTGITNDLRRRVYQHKNPLDKRTFTARYKVDRLVYYETLTDAENAIIREKKIKVLLRKKKEDLINAFNPEWKDLYMELF